MRDPSNGDVIPVVNIEYQVRESPHSPMTQAVQLEILCIPQRACLRTLGNVRDDFLHGVHELDRSGGTCVKKVVGFRNVKIGDSGSS